MPAAVEHVFEFTPAKHAEMVVVTGSFDNWAGKIVMDKAERGFSKRVLIPAETSVEFKFIVDGEWVCDSTKEVRVDAQGNMNNVLAVKLPAKLEEQDSVKMPKSAEISAQPQNALKEQAEKSAPQQALASSLETIDQKPAETSPVKKSKKSARKWWQVWKSNKALAD